MTGRNAVPTANPALFDAMANPEYRRWLETWSNLSGAPEPDLMYRNMYPPVAADRADILLTYPPDPLNITGLSREEQRSREINYALEVLGEVDPDNTFEVHNPSRRLPNNRRWSARGHMSALAPFPRIDLE